MYRSIRKVEVNDVEFCSNVLQLVGNTPLVEITHFPLLGRLRLLEKLEFFNPGGVLRIDLVLN